MSATVPFYDLDEYIQGLAIALAAMTLIAGAMLQYTRKLIGVPKWFREQFNIFKQRPILSIIAAVLYYIILIIPLLLHLAWVITLGVKHGPNPALPVLFLGYFIFGIFIPVSFLFYLKLLILLALFLIGQILAMTLSWDFNSSAYFCLTAIMLTINGLLVSTSLWLVDGACWSLAAAMNGQLKEKVRAKITSWKQQDSPPRIISGGLYYAVCSRPIFRFLLLVFCYIFGILILLAYSLTVYYKTTYGFLGLINSICVISTDVVVYNLIYITKSTNSNPIFNGAAAIIIRICLIAFSGDYWFLGYCLLYLLLIIYIATLIINRYYPRYQKLPSLVLTKQNLFKMPEIPAAMTLILFGALVYYIGIATTSQISVLEATINGTKYPFWAIGVATILLSFSILFYLITIRIVQRAQSRIRSMHFYYLGFEFCGQYYVYLGLSYAFLVILGVYMFYRVGSTIIWASCVFLPLFYQCFIIFYLNWVQNDYLILGDVEAFNKKIKKRHDQIRKIQQQRKSIVKKAKEKGHQMNQQATNLQFSAGEIQQNFFVDADNGKDQYEDWREKLNFIQAARENLLLPTDKKILVSIPLMAVFLIAYSLTYFFITWQHTAFNVSVEILYLFLTFIPVIRYFSTLERPPIPFIISFIIGIIVNYTYGVLSLVLKWNDSIAWTLWWGVLNIFIILLYATFSLLRDKGICIAAIVIAVISGIISLGPGIILMAAFKQIGAGLAVLGAALFYIYVLIAYFIYIFRNKSLHWVFYPITVAIIVAACLAVMIYAFVVDSFDDFYGFSITYLVLNLLLLLLAMYLILLDIRNRFEKPNFYSPYGYPIYKYDLEIKSVKKHSRSLVVWYAAWIMFYGYTILMMIFIQDVYLGISASMIFIIVSYLTIIYFTTYNSYKAGKIKVFLNNEILDAAWQQTLQLFEGAEVPNLQELRQSLQKLKIQKSQQAEAPSKLQVIPNQGGQGNTEQNLNKKKQAIPQDKDKVIQQLQIKISKAEEDEQIMLVNLWTKSIFKYQSGKKKIMLKFTQFIRQSGDFLASIGVSIVLQNDLYDLQSIYNQALQEYNLLSPLQKIQFDKQMKQWAIKKQEADKISEELNQKNLEAEKKRQEELRKKLEQQNKTTQDDENLPVEKMRDSPAKLRKLVETLKQPYRDTYFRASNDILPQIAKGACKGWKRPAAECQMLLGQHAGMSVRQGYIGDCYLISAIGVLGQQHIKKLLGIDVWKNPSGAYMVKFQKYGKDVFIIIDDQFPVNSSNQWLFGRSQNSAQIFVNIIEKAYAKLYGGYQNIAGGKVSLALSEMTGGFPQEIKLKDFQQKNTNQLFQKLVNFKKAGYLMGAGSPENPQGDSVDVDGIVQGHAYIIIDIRDLDGNRLVKLRNPHGNGGIQSRLDWSDDSPKWTKRLLNLANQQLKEDGAFWLSIEDFVHSFRALYICRIFNQNQWKKVGPIAGQWKGKSAAGLPTKKNPKALLSDNPHFGIKVNKRSTIFIELEQNQKDEKRRGLNYIFFMLQKAGGKRIKAFSVNDLVGKSGSPINSISVSAQIELVAPSYPFTFSLMTACIQGGAQGTFNLTLYCNDIDMEFIDNSNFDV